MRKILILLSFLLLLSSCEALRSTWHSSDRRVAKIGGDVLYESEVVKMLPPGTSSADSMQMVRQYVDTWALSKLLLLKAEEKLSKSDKDIKRQVEEFRSDLLGFRYEKLYLEEKLDTIVSRSDMEQYYQEHSQNYILPYSVVKARVAFISQTSPYYDMIRNSFTVTDPDDVRELADLCYSSAQKYNDFGGGWISSETLARELGVNLNDLEKEFPLHKGFEYKEKDDSKLVFIISWVAPGEVSPFDYNKARIQETIISKRKQELLATLERDLLKDAISDKTLKIYEYDE